MTKNHRIIARGNRETGRRNEEQVHFCMPYAAGSRQRGSSSVGLFTQSATG
jgi:hypothetical protein